MAVATSSFNILERLVYDEVKELEASAPRLLVRRRSIPVSEMLRRFADFEDRPGYPVKLLLEARDPADWKPMFTLDEKANRVEREVIELDFATYSDFKRDSQQQIVFAFSAPVAVDGGSLLYGTWTRGALWARGFLCLYQGAFESPGGYETLNIWQT
jgi:hypothetical protein